MELYTNEKGEIVVIATMDNSRLIHGIAKYAEKEGRSCELVKALKTEAMRRIPGLLLPTPWLFSHDDTWVCQKANMVHSSFKVDLK